MDNNNIELYLLRLFFSQTIFQKYSQYLKKEFVRDNSKELYRLYEAVSLFHDTFKGKDIPNVPEFESYFFACYPATNGKERENLSPLFAKLSEINPDPDIAKQVIKGHVERVRATEIALLGMEVAEGRRTYEELLAYSGEAASDADLDAADESPFVTDDLDEILDTVVRVPGLRWRLHSLNQHLGSLRQGDFGFIFKRPETGGTTFLASECTHFATQTERPILWFNNEEQGNKVKFRCIQAAFGVTKEQIVSNPVYFRDKWNQEYAGKIQIIKDKSAVNRRSIESIIGKYPPALVIFDQIDKIKGFKNDRMDLQLTETYQWAREIAEIAPVIGICQAGESAEGKKYLEMDDVSNSKTGKQGEADFILGIGKSHQQGYEQLRHFHLCKNKLIGDHDTIPDRKHWAWDVLIDIHIARYRDCQ